MKKFLLNTVLPLVILGVFIPWCWTLRERNKNRKGEEAFLKREGPYIMTLWHGRIFYLFYHFRRHKDFHLLISPSRDGDVLARLATLMGYSVIRGSSYKQPIASARALIKVLRRGERIILVADGSRGPRCRAQAGSLQIAAMTRTPIFPMTFGARHKIELNSWDRFALPLPFTRCTLNFGDPITVPPKPVEETLLEKQEELQSALNRITLESESDSD